MGFFSDIFRVRADPQRQLLKFSARVSEQAVFEYWLHPKSVLPFVQASNFSEWQGTEEFKGKAVGKDATLGVKTSEGMTYFKMSDSHLWVLRAQLEAACFELGSISETDKVDTPSHITIDLLYTMQNKLQQSVEEMMTAQLENFSANLLAALDTRLSKLNVQPIVVQKPSVESQNISSDTPIFIPSKILQGGIEGNTEIKATESKDDISAAAEALKQLKNTRRKQ